MTMKDFFQILRVALVVTIVFQCINFAFGGMQIEKLTRVNDWLITFMYSGVLSVLNALYFEFVNKRLSWETQARIKTIVSIAGSVILTMVGFYLCRMLHFVSIEGKYSYAEFIKNEKLTSLTYLIVLLVTAIVSLTMHVIGFYKATRNIKIKEQKIIAGSATAQFEALRNQLDPHFLFNSLNVLTSLIEENPRTAQKFTTSLSKVYRYVLEQKNKDVVPVTEELRFAKTYMSLLQTRFEDSIVFSYPEEWTQEEAKIVPLSLQIVLENTVKHNQVSPDKPLHISIYAKDGYLCVQNNLQPKKVLPQESSGVGLINIQTRYKLLTTKNFTVEKSATDFIAKIPILTKKVTMISSPIPSGHLDNGSYERAHQRMVRIKEFYQNLMAYCLVIPLLAFINLYTAPQFLWFLFPMFGWGLGLAFHGMDAYQYNPFLGKNWEDRKIRELMDEN